MNKTERMNLIARVNELRTENKEIIKNMNVYSKAHGIEFDDYAEFPRIAKVLELCFPLVLDGKMSRIDYELLSQESVQYMHNVHVICELQALIK